MLLYCHTRTVVEEMISVRNLVAEREREGNVRARVIYHACPWWLVCTREIISVPATNRKPLPVSCTLCSNFKCHRGQVRLSFALNQLKEVTAIGVYGNDKPLLITTDLMLKLQTVM